MPTAYHERTTPYLPNNAFEADGDDDEEVNFDDFDLNDIDLDNYSPNNNIDPSNINYNLDQDENYQFDQNDIVEAFNPNVRIPRPKMQFSPQRIFNKVSGIVNELQFDIFF